MVWGTAAIVSWSPLLWKVSVDLSEQSAKHLSVWMLKVVMQVHPISTLPWSTPKPKNCPVHPPSPLPPTNFALKGLVSCRTRLCCVRGGNASPLSIEQLFDDGPCWASLWFKSLQRAGLHMGLAYHYSHKWHGSGLHGSHILADNSVRTPCLKKNAVGDKHDLHSDIYPVPAVCLVGFQW